MEVTSGMPHHNYGGYQLGKTYHIAYWGRNCTVIQLQDNVPVWGWLVTVEWEDGRIATHCTPLGKRDKLID